MAIRVTEADLLDALAAAGGAGPDDARTVQEMADEVGISILRVRTALKQLQTARRLNVHRVRRTDLSGRSQTVPGYTILPARKLKRA